MLYGLVNLDISGCCKAEYLAVCFHSTFSTLTLCVCVHSVFSYHVVCSQCVEYLAVCVYGTFNALCVHSVLSTLLCVFMENSVPSCVCSVC